MRTVLPIFITLIFCFAAAVNAQDNFEKDTISTSAGDLEIIFIGHATLSFTFNGMVIHVDPWGGAADFSKLPKADITLLTHDHEDHFDIEALKHTLNDETTLVYTQACADSFPGGIVMRNGMSQKVKGILIEAVPAFTVRIPKRGQTHPEGECNGYILTFGDKRVYIASETENIPALKEIKDIDIAFLAMDGEYNLSPIEAVEVVKVFNPKVIYPYHYANADLTPFIEAFENIPEIEVRLRDMKMK